MSPSISELRAAMREGRADYAMLLEAAPLLLDIAIRALDYVDALDSRRARSDYRERFDAADEAMTTALGKVRR